MVTCLFVTAVWTGLSGDLRDSWTSLSSTATLLPEGRACCWRYANEVVDMQMRSLEANKGIWHEKMNQKYPDEFKITENINREIKWDFSIYCCPFWMMSSGDGKLIRNHFNQPYLKGNVSDYAVTTAPADGLAPLGARPSADRVMAKFGFWTSTELALGGLTHWLQRCIRNLLDPQTRW